MPRALVAPDSFKGTMTAPEVANALAAGLGTRGVEADICPLADGGEGTAAVLLANLGGRWVETRAVDPLGREIEVRFALLTDGRAALDVAEASGLGLVATEERDVLAATSHGTGQLIAAAASHATAVLVGVGGSATNDGGAGAIAAIEEAGGIGDTRLTLLCDVATPWERASATFGPQKGASPDEVHQLERRLNEFATTLRRDPQSVPHGGAAGGLAGGLWAQFTAELVPGAAFVCDAINLDGRLTAADIAIGGEGKLDETTLEGKALCELAARARRAQVALYAVVGSDASTPEVRSALGLAGVAEASNAAALQAAGASLAGSAG